MFNPYFMFNPYSQICKKHQTHKDPTEEVKKKLKRDFEFSFDKDDRLYRYKGQEISEKEAIEIVKEYGVAELKERLVE